MIHPEDFCAMCTRPNPVWFAPSETWNEAMPADALIVCPSCFAAEWERVTGRRVAWRFEVETLASVGGEQ